MGVLNFAVKKESKHSIFAGNILSQKSVSHASSKIITEKFKSNNAKSSLEFMPKFLTNTNMVKNQETAARQRCLKSQMKKMFQTRCEKLDKSSQGLKNSVTDRINHRKSHCYKHSKIAPNEQKHLDRKGR